MNLMKKTSHVFEEFGTKPAIINQKGSAITFEHLGSSVNRLIFILQKRGINKGDRVLLFVPVDIELYSLMIAIFSIGATVVFIDPWAGTAYIDHALRKVEPNFLIYIPKVKLLTLFSKNLRKIQTQITLDEIFYEQRTIEEKPSFVEVVQPDDTALITFTTGSSDNPKGFNRTHHFLLEQQHAHEIYFNHNNDDIDLCMFPVFVLSNLASGMTSVLADVDLKNIDGVRPERLVEQIKTFNVTSLTCSPALVQPLATYCLQQNITLPEMKKFYTGGAPVKSDLFAELSKVFIESKMYLVYGSTEAEPIALMDSDEVLSLNRSMTKKGAGVVLGRVVENLNYKIIPITPEPLSVIQEVDSGEIGELILSGDFVGTSYYKNEQAFIENKISVEDIIWHRTGDVVYEKEGVLYMVGRKHNALNEGGDYFFPLQIEPIIDAVNGVKKCAYWQKDSAETALLLSLESGADKHRVIEDVQEVLSARSRNPLLIHFTNKMPLDKRHNAKIDYRQIQINFGEKMSKLTKDDFILKRFWGYTQERFPLMAIIIFALLFVLNAGLSTLHFIPNGHGVAIFPAALATVVIFLVFFHLRLLDEFKDYADDCVAYPERLLSRGVVTLNLLGKTAFVFIIIELIAAAFLGKPALIMALAMIIYSLLMFKEFFIGKWLRQSLLAYLISHQFILPLMVFFVIISFLSIDQATQFNRPILYTLFAIVSLPSTIYEIARKTWSADRESENADSYTRVWGVKITSLVLTALYLLYYGLGIYFMRHAFFAYSGIYLLTALTFFGVVTTIMFMFRPTTKMSKMVERAGSAMLLGAHLSFILGAYFAA